MHTGVVAGIVAYFSLIIEQPATYQTALGTFVTNNQGEFGGELTLPNGEIMQGNFCEIIECGNHVYAIDSCGHMGMGYFSLYSIF